LNLEPTRVTVDGRQMALFTSSTCKWSYPSVRRDTSVVDQHFQVKVEDPYRWLEDPDSEETKMFVAAQNAVSEPYLASCTARDKFHARRVTLLNH